MRYPQMFATLAIADWLDAGMRKGIIWHTQGSGKTALAYYNVAFSPTGSSARTGATLLFHRRSARPAQAGPRRIPLARADRACDRQSRRVCPRHQGEWRRSKTIAAGGDHVVNIQKFKDDPDVTTAQDYNLTVQRVYFLDEVHRSYNPKGSFLANLEQSDRNAIKIGLTGTPLIGEQLQSKALFGDYIHKYYYNASIADGYTLRLIREEIATHYKMQMQQALADIEVQQGDIDAESAVMRIRVSSARCWTTSSTDFRQARVTHGDDSIGGMVICDSAEQARELHR